MGLHVVVESCDLGEVSKASSTLILALNLNEMAASGLEEVGVEVVAAAVVEH